MMTFPSLVEVAWAADLSRLNLFNFISLLLSGEERREHLVIFICCFFELCTCLI